MTPLGQWMLKHQRRDQWLADQLGCTQPQACRIRQGTSATSPDRAFMIEKITKGAVKAASVLMPDRSANDPSPNRKAA
ncbi:MULTISPECIES: helix-turn-helix domain-containing protein [unclassified Brevundimonas]|uniref:helix-turn-helix domain-containing protein n=1 Tax=unclassified Brevundimonas TaxID=2622653 RepID=UPI00142F6D8F|nr:MULTISPECIES: helix-turn-helix domain-containing protein [unclassified Brevundimonas]